MTHDELAEMIANPSDSDRDLLNDYISTLDLDTFYFEPIKENESIDYDYIEHSYYENSDDKIRTGEIIIYKVSSTGQRKEIKRFMRASYIMLAPENNPGYLFFYINERRDRYGYYFWRVDGEAGIGEMVASDSGYSLLTDDAEYLFKFNYVKHKHKGYEVDFPVICIYSISARKVLKEYDLFKYLKESPSEDDFMDGLYYDFHKNGNIVMAELKSMESDFGRFFINLNSLDISMESKNP